MQYDLSPNSMNSTKTGKIKHLNEKGYGFIAKDDGGEIYFHASKCGKFWTREKCQLEQGMAVQFSEGKSIKGTLEARDVHIAEPSNDGVDLID